MSEPFPGINLATVRSWSYGSFAPCHLEIWYGHPFATAEHTFDTEEEMMVFELKLSRIVALAICTPTANA